MTALQNPGPRPLAVAHDRPKPAKPDARPMRAALGLGGIAAMSAIAAGIVSPPRPSVPAAPVFAMPAATDTQPSDAANGAATDQQGDGSTGNLAASATRQIIFVQLRPGETAPPGATVLPASSQPTIAVQLSGSQPAATARPAATPTPKPVPKPTPIIIKTTQSGKVVP